MRAVSAIFVFLAFCQFAAAEELGRFNLDGRTISVDSDGTWSYVEEEQEGDCTVLTLARPEIRFCLRDSFWRRAELGGSFALGFEAKSADLYLGVIGESTVFDMETMRQLIRENARDSAGLKGLTDDSDNTVTLNGQEWGIVRFELEYGSAPITFENYFTVVEGEGTAQFVFWAPSQAFESTAEARERVVNTFNLVQ